MFLRFALVSAEQERVKAKASMPKSTCVKFWDAKERGGWFAEGARRGLGDDVAARSLGLLSCSESPACVDMILFYGLLSWGPEVELSVLLGYLSDLRCISTYHECVERCFKSCV